MTDDIPRCQHVSASPWGPTQCVLGDGHTVDRHAYSPSESLGGDLETIVTAALVKPLPCTRCERTDGNCPCLVPVAERLEARTRHVIAELDRTGYLTTPTGQAADTGPTIEDDARELAEASQHPRFVLIEDGWRDLLGSESYVLVAHRAANGRAGYASTDVVDKLNAARDRLLAHVRAAQRVTETQGR